MYSCTHWPKPCNSPPPPHLGSHTRALLVSQDRRHLFETPCLLLTLSKTQQKTYRQKMYRETDVSNHCLLLAGDILFMKNPPRASFRRYSFRIRQGHLTHCTGHLQLKYTLHWIDFISSRLKNYNVYLHETYFLS